MNIWTVLCLEITNGFCFIYYVLYARSTVEWICVCVWVFQIDTINWPKMGKTGENGRMNANQTSQTIDQSKYIICDCHDTRGHLVEYVLGGGTQNLVSAVEVEAVAAE